MGKILSFGEVLLRLASPGYTRLFQKDSLDATFCGAEANVAVSLAVFGLDSAFMTILPDGVVGDAALNSMRYFGVDTSRVIRDGKRVGLYYLEKGASQRPSKVIYDREFSAIALAQRKDFDWDSLLEGVSWFHWTGINPALSGELEKICMDACIVARSKGITVSCDLNYRGSLWNPGKARTVMATLMPYVDVCIANEEDADKALGIKQEETEVKSGKICTEAYQKTAAKICDLYGCKKVAFTLRKSYSASRNGWSGLLYDAGEKKPYLSKEYDIQIVDRVGGGDSFAAGLIYGMNTAMDSQSLIEFAAAASCLKQTMEGDYNRSSVEEVKTLMESGGNGRISR